MSFESNSRAFNRVATERDRVAKRKRVVMTGSLITPDGTHGVRIRDISAVGAQICADLRIRPECDSVFKRGALFVAAKVIWATEREAGIRFYRDLSDEEFHVTFGPAWRDHLA